jgi:hypothetical protein
MSSVARKSAVRQRPDNKEGESAISNRRACVIPPATGAAETSFGSIPELAPSGAAVSVDVAEPPWGVPGLFEDHAAVPP